MRAFVSDQSGNFEAVPIGTGPPPTIVAALELPPGSWVAFATVALSMGVSATPTDVEAGFLLDGVGYSPFVQTRFAVGTTLSFAVVPVTTGLTLDSPQTLQVVCQASQPDTVVSQPTTITAIQVESVTRIRDQFLGGP
jgi:hypothetical protein